MSERSYPVVLDWDLVSTGNYTGMVGMKCGTCGHVLGKRERFWRRETQVSWMRGDDEVEIKCTACAPTPEKERGKP